MSTNQNQPIKIAVVGDIHSQWGEEDHLALAHLDVDLVLFVGDFGNEEVEIVRKVASLDMPKAIVLGNHDAWYTASKWGQHNCPYDPSQEDRVQEQLDILGDLHVGFSKLDFPQLNLSVVGGRPFSWGGSRWKNRRFLRARYDVGNFNASAYRILDNVKEAAYDTIVFLGHNGPLGLGKRPKDICGRDWEPLGGDYGDPDLAKAIKETREMGKSVPLVCFGHMHHRLRYTQEKLRRMAFLDAEGTVHVNAASVPRIIEEDDQRLRNFTIVSLENNLVSQVALVWIGKEYSVVSEKVLYPKDKLHEIGK